MTHTRTHSVGLTIVLLTDKVEVLLLNLLSPTAVLSHLLRHQLKQIWLITIFCLIKIRNVRLSVKPGIRAGSTEISIGQLLDQ